MLGCLLFPAPLLLVPLAAGSHTLVLGCLFFAEFGSALGVLILDISVGSIFAAVIPGRLQARVSGAYRTVNYGIRPLGALTGGALGSTIGLHATLWIAAIGGLTACLWLVHSPIPKMQTLTGKDDELRTG
jgi:predicted MFS family arabinose efflux permease